PSPQFPTRRSSDLLAFAVILTTLLAQGLTLPWLVNRLGVRADTAGECALERQLAVRVAKAARRRLEQIDAEEGLPGDLVELFDRRVTDLALRISPEAVDDERREAYARRADRIKLVRRVEAELLSAARQEVLAARRDPSADPEVVDRLLRRLDVRGLRP